MTSATSAADGDDGADYDPVAGEPVDLFAALEHDLHHSESHRQQTDSGPVDRARRRASRYDGSCTNALTIIRPTMQNGTLM